MQDDAFHSRHQPTDMNYTLVVLQTAMFIWNMTAKNNLNDLPTGEGIISIGDTNDPEPDSNSTRCYGIYGCFDMDAPWKSQVRPINYPPESPEKISPDFCLYTRRNPHSCQRLDITKWNGTFLNPKNKVVMISHGYLEDGEKPWIASMTKELLLHSDLNVIVIGWGGGSKPPYSQAVANIRVVGAMVGHLIHFMVQYYGVDVKKVHIIGHSLGAHLASYAGHTLQTVFHMKIHRITGLDPAEPHFTKTDPIVRLDPTDAEFVDVVHTDAGPFMSGGFGLMEPVGHVDFYPNGGVDQPGCADNVFGHIGKAKGSLIKGLRSFVGCNHIRSYEYYTESINSKCPFMAIECTSWEEFKNGSCFKCGKEYSIKHGYKKGQSYCSKFGYSASPHALRNSNNRLMQRRHVKLYLMTSSERPFCQQHFKVTVNISSSVASYRHGGEVGNLWIILESKNSTHRVQVNERETLFEPGTHHRFVVSTNCLESIQSVSVEWSHKTSVLNPLTWRIITVSHLFLDYVMVESLETLRRHQLCPVGGRTLYSGDTVQLKENYDCEMKQWLS